MIVSMIAAIGKNNELGKDNQLLWHLPNDLKFFKKHTQGHCVIMGRNTLESIGRALPNRKNIMVSQTGSTDIEQVAKAVSIPDAIEMARESGEDECFIIGGGKIYIEAIDMSDRLYITRVDATFDADVHFPQTDWDEWKLISKEDFYKDEKHDYDYSFEIYERKQPL